VRLKKGEALRDDRGNGKDHRVILLQRRGSALGNGRCPHRAGRSPSYIARQMYDIQVGARHGEWAEIDESRSSRS